MSDETPEIGLDAAYALKTPEDSKRLYEAWAKTYDADFAEASDYRLPMSVAAALAARQPSGPALDIGAGTGLAGAAFKRLWDGQIDGTDISQDMLDTAAQKAVYTRLFAGDMTKRLPVQDRAYGAVLSSGTFTTGHVGPEALDEVLRVMRQGAIAAISISMAHWDAAGFRAKFETMAAQITSFELHEVRIYGARAEGAHARDMGYVAVFERG